MEEEVREIEGGGGGLNSGSVIGVVVMIYFGMVWLAPNSYSLYSYFDKGQQCKPEEGG